MDATELRRLLSYDPETGVFTWRVTEKRGHNGNGFSIKSGTVAGSTSQSYVRIGALGRNYLAHRLAFLYMTGEWPNGVVDHIDGNSQNNAWSNLRVANQSQNVANGKLAKNNKSGFKGVYRHNQTGRYVALIHANGKKHHLGCFATPEEAHAAYMDAATKHFGEFARAK
jgi:hypothetical protein